jgi:hypothetical protein
VDIDDCLIDSRKTYEFLPYFDKNIEYSVEEKREAWDKWTECLCLCTPNYHIVDLIKRYKDDTKIFFITSREVRLNCIEETRKIVDKCFISVDGLNYEILMRNENDYRSSSDVKRDIYNMCIKGRYNILFAIDDLLENIEMYKELGINTLQCRYGDK